MSILQAARCDKCKKVGYSQDLKGWIELDYRITTRVSEDGEGEGETRTTEEWTGEVCAECAKALLEAIAHPT